MRKDGNRASKSPGGLPRGGWVEDGRLGPEGREGAPKAKPGVEELSTPISHWI